MSDEKRSSSCFVVRLTAKQLSTALACVELALQDLADPGNIKDCVETMDALKAFELSSAEQLKH